MGLPANRTSKEPLSAEQIAKLNAGRKKKGLPELETDPETGVELTFDDKRPRFHRGTDDKYYDRQSRLSSPETKERVTQTREGSLKFHPDTGWVRSDSPNALVNLRGRGQKEEADRRAREKFAPAIQQPKKMAASEKQSKVEKRCWEGYKPTPGKKPYSEGSCQPVKKSEDGADAKKAHTVQMGNTKPHMSHEEFSNKGPNFHSNLQKQHESLSKESIGLAREARKAKNKEDEQKHSENGFKHNDAASMHRAYSASRTNQDPKLRKQFADLAAKRHKELSESK
jgi:hypothetical protein